VRADHVRGVGVRNVERAAGHRDDHGHERQTRVLECGGHGQNPRSIEKKKLRVGGNGATSMFRTIAWRPKLLTSGSSPRYGVNRSRLRPVSESLAFRMRRPNSEEVSRSGRLYDRLSSRSFT